MQLDAIADRHDTLELLVDAHTTNDALRAGMRKVSVESRKFLQACIFQACRSRQLESTC